MQAVRNIVLTFDTRQNAQADASLKTIFFLDKMYLLKLCEICN